MRKSAIRLGWLPAAILLLAGCSTPAHRIQKNQAYFDSLPTEQQTAIQAGSVHPGFPSQAVYLALGRPDRIYRRTTASGVRTVWTYTRTETRSDSDWVSVPVTVRGRDGSIHRSTDRVRVSVDHKREYDWIRVEFENDQVVAIEELANNR